MPASKAAQLEELELDLLLTAIREHYGYDFTQYSRASLHRRALAHAHHLGLSGLAELIPLVLRSPDAFSALLIGLTITVTEMFRDPAVYRVLREEVVPWLKTFPFVKIWHAGCATGEEVYSMAILLEEEGLGDAVQIYATDINPLALQNAAKGIYSPETMRESTENYRQAGGRRSFADYYFAQSGAVVTAQRLRDRVHFARHNLVGDGSFGEMHLILCRNVLIYFNQALQERAYGLFRESLVHKGYLCLGTAENIDTSTVGFEVVSQDAHLYRRSAGKSGVVHPLDDGDEDNRR